MLVRGLCLQPTDFILCTFDGDRRLGDYFDDNTAICSTPIMTTTGTVEVALRRGRLGVSSLNLGSIFTTGKYEQSMCFSE